MKIKKAVIPCGGIGTRFMPITKAVAKEMLPIIDRPVLDYIVDEIVSAGIEEILLIISPSKDIIKKYYSQDEELVNLMLSSGKNELAKMIKDISTKAKISYAVQQVPKGSGDAVLLAENFANGEPFALLLGDDIIYNEKSPAIAQLCKVYEKYEKTVLGVQRRQVPDILKYGVINPLRQEEESVYSIKGILEKPQEKDLTSDLACLGRYVISPKIFDVLKETPIGKNNELQLTDGLNILCQQEGGYAYIFEGIRYDMGDKMESLKAITEYALRDKNFGEEYKKYLIELVKNI